MTWLWLGASSPKNGNDFNRIDLHFSWRHASENSRESPRIVWVSIKFTMYNHIYTHYVIMYHFYYIYVYTHILYYTILYFTILYHTIPYHTILYYTNSDESWHGMVGEMAPGQAWLAASRCSPRTVFRCGSGPWHSYNVGPPNPARYVCWLPEDMFVGL